MSKEKHLFIISLLLIPLILTIIWFRNGLIHGGGEEGILYYNSQKTFLLSTSTWAEFETGLFVSSWLQRAPVMYLSNISQQAGPPPILFQSTLFYILMVTGILSVYYLTLNLLYQYKEKFQVSLISALFYLFNPFSFSQVWGRGLSAQYYGFALLPLSLLLFHLGIKRKQYIFGLLLALISTIMATAYEWLTFIVVYWLILLIYSAFHIITSKEKFRGIFFNVTFVFFTFVVWCLFNSWWFIPLFSSSGSQYSANISGLEENLGTLLGVSRSFTLDVIVRLLQNGYFFDSTAYSQVYSTLPFQLISFIPLFFVLFGLVKIFRNPELEKFKFFVVLLALGLIISLGANPPFGWLFIWFFKHFTVLQAFRNPFEKFGLVYVLGYCPVFAYGLVSFLEKKRFKNLTLILILFLTCVIYAWPMWTGRVIAGYDKKIGLDVPTYYKDLRNWLNDNDNGYRLLMTPIWSGDSAFYQWNNAARYQGSDPMLFMLDQNVISNGAHGVYYFDFISSIRKYMEREDIVPALSLMRVKFLVDRTDAIMATNGEKNQINFLTSKIYPPLGVDNSSRVICQNQVADSKTNDLAWLTCHIDSENMDLSKVRYLYMRVKIDSPAILQVSLRDTSDKRIGWDGRVDQDYRTNTNSWQYIILPLRSPTQNDNNIDLGKSNILEVWAQPNDNQKKSVKEISVSEVRLDSGTEKEINEFKKIEQFGKLVVYEPTNFNSPPEFGNLSSLDYVSNLVQLFKEAEEKRNLIDNKGFILISQNPQKNLEELPKESPLQLIDKNKISNTRYWLKIRKEDNQGLIILSKTYDFNWKIIPNIGLGKLKGNLLDDINLLKATTLDEKNHYVVNGYANLWKVDGKNSDYAIVFMPQIIADISLKISKFVTVLAIGILVALAVRKIVKKLN